MTFRMNQEERIDVLKSVVEEAFMQRAATHALPYPERWYSGYFGYVKRLPADVKMQFLVEVFEILEGRAPTSSSDRSIVAALKSRSGLGVKVPAGTQMASWVKAGKKLEEMWQEQDEVLASKYEADLAKGQQRSVTVAALKRSEEDYARRKRSTF